MSNINTNKSFIRNGNYDGGAAFMAFLKATDQKITHNLIMEELYGKIINAFDKAKPVAFIDLACGDGKESAKVVEKLSKIHQPGVKYLGFDFDPRFVDATQKYMESIDNLLIDFSVVEANLFDDKPFPTTKQDNALSTVGHALYYGGKDGSGIPAFTQKLESILGERSLCVLTHNGMNCELSSIRTLVAKDVIAQPTKKFSESAEDSGMGVFSLESKSRLYFPKLTPGEWRNLRDPNLWQQHGRAEFTQALELISFISQQGLPVPDLIKEARDKKNIIDTTNRLSTNEFNIVVDLVQQRIGKPERSQKPFIEIHSDYQIAAPKNRQEDISPAIESALSEISDNLDNLESQARNEFLRGGRRVA